MKNLPALFWEQSLMFLEKKKKMLLLVFQRLKQEPHANIKVTFVGMVFIGISSFNQERSFLRMLLAPYHLCSQRAFVLPCKGRYLLGRNVSSGWKSIFVAGFIP